AYRAQLAVDSGESVVVGVNTFKVTADGESFAGSRALLTNAPQAQQRQIEGLRAVRPTRRPDTWRAGLDAVAAAARDGVNLVPPIVAAVEARATLGEIADAMRGVFGEYQETATV